MKLERWLLAGLVATVGAACGGVTDQTDTDSPIVFITSPLDDSTVGGSVNFAAQALDGFGVAKVEFLVDGAVVGEDFTEPFAVLWNSRNAGNGPHALRAQATDHAGNVGFASIGVTVDNTRQ